MPSRIPGLVPGQSIYAKSDTGPDKFMPLRFLTHHNLSLPPQVTPVWVPDPPQLTTVWNRAEYWADKFMPIRYPTHHNLSRPPQFYARLDTGQPSIYAHPQTGWDTGLGSGPINLCQSGIQPPTTYHWVSGPDKFMPGGMPSRIPGWVPARTTYPSLVTGPNKFMPSPVPYPHKLPRSGYRAR
jgi:hypothetical protein